MQQPYISLSAVFKTKAPSRVDEEVVKAKTTCCPILTDLQNLLRGRFNDREISGNLPALQNRKNFVFLNILKALLSIPSSAAPYRRRGNSNISLT